MTFTTSSYHQAKEFYKPYTIFYYCIADKNYFFVYLSQIIDNPKRSLESEWICFSCQVEEDDS